MSLTDCGSIKKVAIANRGEVAVRIMRACHELELKTVLLHSEADIGTRAYRLADERLCIGPAPTSQSYLNIARNVDAAVAAGAQAVHPGFGFLSENPGFAEACSEAGLIFIGPSAAAIRTLGDKVSAKELAIKAALPLVPGYAGECQEVDFLKNKALEMGLPVIVKAAAGGGGRGMKVIRTSQESEELIASAQREAQTAFGSSHVFLEKYLDRAKHIEFQIFVDSSGRVLHLLERECSVQRRHQKIIEEALSPSLNDELREQMGRAAVELVKLTNYRGAGTVEFMLQDHQFYFLEMNTRLQVEHPVTELVLGVDLVKAQILTAAGQPVFSSLSKEENRKAMGHAIECRVYAEDPYSGGIPSTGMLGLVRFPEGPGRRFEYGFEKGDEITPFYDPMIAKIIVWDETRLRCIEKMIRVLKETVILGVKTNIPLLIEMLSHPEFILGTMTTQFVDSHFKNGLTSPSEKEIQKAFQDFTKRMGLIKGKTSGLSSINPWTQAWRGV